MAGNSRVIESQSNTNSMYYTAITHNTLLRYGTPECKSFQNLSEVPDVKLFDLTFESGLFCIVTETEFHRKLFYVT